MIVEDMRREMMRRIAAASKKSDERGREGEREKERKRERKKYPLGLHLGSILAPFWLNFGSKIAPGSGSETESVLRDLILTNCSKSLHFYSVDEPPTKSASTSKSAQRRPKRPPRTHSEVDFGIGIEIYCGNVVFSKSMLSPPREHRF